MSDILMTFPASTISDQLAGGLIQCSHTPAWPSGTSEGHHAHVQQLHLILHQRFLGMCLWNAICGNN